MGRASVGDQCYPKAVPGAYGAVVSGRIRDEVKNALGTVLEKALQQALVKHLGLDLLSPDDQVRDGDRVLLPGGHEEILPEGSVEDLKSWIEDLSEVFGVGDPDEENLITITDKASALRVRLGGVLQTLTGDGCDDFLEGVQALEQIAKDYSARADKGESLRDFLKDTPDQDQLSDLFEALGIDCVKIGSMPEAQGLAFENLKMLIHNRDAVRTRLLTFTGREPGTDLPTEEILRLVLNAFTNEAARQSALRFRIHKLTQRIVGECPSNLDEETMLSRIEEALGPEPEF